MKASRVGIRWWIRLALALGALVAGPVTAQVVTVPPPPSGTASVTPARMALGLELAKELNSEALTRTQLDKMMKDNLPKAFEQNPNMAMLERAYPGATAAVISAVAPAITDYTIATLPQMWATLAPIYAGGLEEAEMRALLAFYRGPTGQRVIAAMGRGSDYGGTITRMMNEGSAAVTEGDLRGGASAGIAEVVRTASDEDQAAMIALMQSGAGRKLAAVTAAVMQKIAAVASAPEPAFQKRIETITKAALDAHIKKSGK